MSIIYGYVQIISYKIEYMKSKSNQGSLNSLLVTECWALESLW